MTDFNVEPDMTRATMIDEKIESLLGGTSPDAGDPLATELAFMRQGLFEAFPLPVISEQVEDAHLARMMAARVPAAAFVAAEVAADRTGPLERLKASIGRKVAAGTLAFSTLFGGAAYAGALPDPVQRAVAKAASIVGLELPGGEDDALAGDDSEDGPRDTRPGDADRGPAPAGVGSESERSRSGASDDDDEDRRDDERDAKGNGRDEAEDRRDDERDDREDAADRREDEDDDARDAREDAEDDAEDEAERLEDEAEDRRDEERDERENERDELEDAADDERDQLEEAQEELEELEESRRERGEVDRDDSDAHEDD